jgi:hypothetical protein
MILSDCARSGKTLLVNPLTVPSYPNVSFVLWIFVMIIAFYVLHFF